jgi:hypothetical protein
MGAIKSGGFHQWLISSMADLYPHSGISNCGVQGKPFPAGGV